MLFAAYSLSNKNKALPQKTILFCCNFIAVLHGFAIIEQVLNCHRLITSMLFEGCIYSRGRPKFGFGAKTDQISSFGQISVSAEFEYLIFGSISVSAKNEFIDSAKAE